MINMLDIGRLRIMYVIFEAPVDAEFPESESVFFMYTKCSLDADMVASSAYSIVLIRLMNSGISLIYAKNKRGPKNDHWGTSQLMVCGWDSVFLTHTRCVRLARYDWNQQIVTTLHW